MTTRNVSMSTRLPPLPSTNEAASIDPTLPNLADLRSGKLMSTQTASASVTCSAGNQTGTLYDFAALPMGTETDLEVKTSVHPEGINNSTHCNIFTTATNRTQSPHPKVEPSLRRQRRATAAAAMRPNSGRSRPSTGEDRAPRRAGGRRAGRKSAGSPRGRSGGGACGHLAPALRCRSRRRFSALVGPKRAVTVTERQRRSR